MPLTFEHIIEAADLFEAIHNLNSLSADEEMNLADVLVEHYDALEQHERKEEFADNLVLRWPDSEIKELGTAIRAIHTHEDSETTLHHLLAIRFAVRKRIMSLTDARNHRPHELFLDEEFNADLFNECDTFSAKLIDNDLANRIAQRLAATTPSNQLSKVARNISLAFPDSSLTVAVGAAFEGVRNHTPRVQRPSLFPIANAEQPEAPQNTPTLK